MSYRIIYENIIGRDVFFYYVCPFCGTNHKLQWDDFSKEVELVFDYPDGKQLFHVSKQTVSCHECDTEIDLVYRDTENVNNT